MSSTSKTKELQAIFFLQGNIKNKQNKNKQITTKEKQTNDKKKKEKKNYRHTDIMV